MRVLTDIIVSKKPIPIIVVIKMIDNGTHVKNQLTVLLHRMWFKPQFFNFEILKYL
ncbi:MAG: hypothetical protein ACI8SE_002155 [Bacteroidia bacterium]|jgi:hypothetical protein